MEPDLNIPIGERHVSWSQLSQAQSCEWRWHLRNVLQARTPKQYRAPAAGSAIHIGCAAMLKGEPLGDSVNQWMDKEVWKIMEWEQKGGFDMDEDIEMIKSLVAPAISICERWWEWLDYDASWETVIDPNDGEPIIEKTYMCILPPFSGFLGVVDWVAKSKRTGLTYVIDHKSRAQMTSPEVEETNLQKAAYQHLLAENGIITDGSMIDQIWREPMKVPKQNQDGACSKAKIRTTWPVYMEELIRLGHDPDDYFAMVDKCNPIEDFYRWSEAQRSDLEVRNTWEQVVVPRAMRIANMLNHPAMEGGISAPPRRALGSPGFMGCETCWARETCLEDLRGTNWNDALTAGGLIIVPPNRSIIQVEDPDEEFEMASE